jgi:hypothetical protein
MDQSTKWSAAIALALVSSLAALARTRCQGSTSQEQFMAIDVFVDSGSNPLAAWQVELADTSGRARVVGIEGGEHPAFQEAPYYDPAALQRGRIILGAFHVGDDLPGGRTRVARVHLLVSGGEPELVIAPMVAATRGGRTIDIRAELER